MAIIASTSSHAQMAHSGSRSTVEIRRTADVGPVCTDTRVKSSLPKKTQLPKRRHAFHG